MADPVFDRTQPYGLVSGSQVGAWFSQGGHYFGPDENYLFSGEALLQDNDREVVANDKLELGDVDGVVVSESENSITLTVPPQSEVNWPSGAEIKIVRNGTGALIVSAGAGVTINASDNVLTVLQRYGVAILKRAEEDVWNLLNDTSGSLYEFEDLATFLADTTYQASDFNTGDIIVMRREGTRYEVVTSGEEIQNTHPTSPVKLLKITTQIEIDALAAQTAAEAARDLAEGYADDAAAFAGFRDFADLATLQANTTLSYSGGDPVSVGDVIRTRKEGFSFSVISSVSTGDVANSNATPVQMDFNLTESIKNFPSAGLPLRNVSANLLPNGDITIPGVFNDTLGVEVFWDGEKVQYKQSPYDLVDWSKSEASINHYYVNYSEGDNANAGTSTGSGNSWKTLDYAISNATSPAVVHLEDDRIGYLSSGSATKSFNGRIKFLGEGSSGRTIIAAMRESYDKASFSWTATGSADAYKSATSSAKQYRCMFDGNYRNAKGIPRAMSAASSAANCESTPGTFFWDSGATELYVHMFDGREPDPADGWLYGESPFDFEIHQSGSAATDVILFENIEFISNNGNTTNGATFRYRPATTGSVTSARLGLKNCLAYGSHDNGFEVYDADIVVVENCHAYYNHADGFNYHSFVTTGTDGEFITVYEHDCTAFYNGYDEWDDQATLSTSTNATTSHDSMHILRTNGSYGECNGAVVADVNGVCSVNLNVKAGPAKGTASPKACFWHEIFNGVGTTKRCYLWGCSASDGGDTDVQLIDNTAQSGSNSGEFYVQNWLGQIDGAITGIIKDFSGNSLS